MPRKQIVFALDYHRRMKKEAKLSGKLLEARAKELVDKGWRYEKLESSGVLQILTDCQGNPPEARP